MGVGGWTRPQRGQQRREGQWAGHRQAAGLQHRPRASILVARLGCWVLAPWSSTLALTFTLALAFSAPIPASFSFTFYYLKGLCNSSFPLSAADAL